jgi:hypothetical protein
VEQRESRLAIGRGKNLISLQREHASKAAQYCRIVVDDEHAG